MVFYLTWSEWSGEIMVFKPWSRLFHLLALGCWRDLYHPRVCQRVFIVGERLAIIKGVSSGVVEESLSHDLGSAKEGWTPRW